MLERITDFKGVWQAAGDSALSAKYAYDAQNVSTLRGALSSAPGFSAFLPPIEPVETPGEYVPIGTLARLYRRKSELEEAAREVFVACTLDGIFTYTAADGGWTRRLAGPLYSDAWDWVTYEEAGDDVLILTNAQDGMKALYGADLRIESKETPVKFGVLGRHAERIWGAGVEDEPDSLYYSCPYDPFNWAADEENPEMGGGQILQPTWDGDRFIALRSLGAYLIALKTRSIYQVRGTDPSSFVITQEYGADAPDAENTIAVDGARMFYMTGREIGVYDGVSAQLLAKDALCMSVTSSDPDAAGAICGHVYYLALPKEGKIVEFDTTRSTFMIRTGIHVRAFLESDGELYFTSGTDPYRVYRYATGADYDGQPIPCKWQTGWFESGGQYVRKEFFLLRFYARGGEGAVLRATLETEERRKERAVSLRPEGKAYRIRFPVRGVRWRLTLESEGVQPFSITGGLEVSADDEKLE